MGPKPDWVYRPDVYDATGALIDALGTYKNEEDALSPTSANMNAHVLYDSHNRIKHIIDVPSNAPRVLSAAARAEGARAFIHRVQGLIFVRPSAWALGNEIRICFRFGVFEQDPVAGGFALDPLYTLWDTGTDVNANPAAWANDRRWQHERRAFWTFSDNQAAWKVPFNFRVNRRLDPGECYGVLSATRGGGVNCYTQFWLRTLVSDEG